VEAIIRERARMPSSPSSPTPNSSAKAPRSRISSARTASWSAPTTSARGRDGGALPPAVAERRAHPVTDRRTAELTKYAANAFLATKITFINEIADLCEEVGADVQLVARGIGMDKRIGPKFLNAGPGYGGSCFPKDTLALIRSAQDHGVSLRVVESVVAVNDARKAAMARKVVKACGGSVQGKTVAVLGLTFKPNTDDMRDAPSISIIDALQRAGATIRAHDPVGMEQAKRCFPTSPTPPTPMTAPRAPTRWC
jgi:nucleotide sugar dehydrogenase